MARRIQERRSAPRWQDIDLDTRNKFTLNGQIELVDYFISTDSQSGDMNPTFYSSHVVDSFIEAVKRRQTNYYGITDFWLYTALDDHPVRGKDVAVIGSLQPWYEAICLEFGGNPYTIEYNKIQTNDPRLNLTTLDEYRNNPRKFKAVFSISSFEHDGLGRYGDPIDPEGDFRAMKEVKETFLEPGGLLYLGVPCGKDKLSFNAHRIYGNKRFNKLIEGFEIVDCYPRNFNEMLEVETGRSAPQPIVVLRSKE
jgi:hypothetical protein